MNTYTVKANDNLWSIAIDHGFKSEQDLLAVQENKDLFSSTKRNEYRIYPGDIIHIPAKKEAKFKADANGKRIFRIPSRKGFIRFKPHDVEGNPLSKFRFEAEFQDQTFKGDETTDNGDIEIELPKVEKDGKLISISDYLKDINSKLIPVDEKLKLTTIKMKLYTNANAPEHYDDYIIHINFDPNDNKEGQLQKLSNEGLYNGYIPKVDYEKSLGRVDNSCYPDDVWPEHQLSSMDENGSNLLPIPAPINFQPQYYPVVWEMLRYERLFKISKNQVESLERKLEQLKESKQPYDTTHSQYLQAEIDKEYYQYCFNYWFSEFSSLWHAHTTKDASADALIRLRSHVLVDEKLTEITEKWRSEFEAETIKDEILDKQYPEGDVKHIPQVRDIFTTFYSTQQAKDKLTTKIVSPPLTSKVRFSYQDDPDTPIANSYVLYWRYDKADTNKIETGREEFYNNARIMMPIGIGKTDKFGYLTQSLPFDDEEFGTYVKIDDGHFTMHAGLDSLKGLSHDYLQPFMARFESNSDYQKYINSIKRLDGSWNDIFNEINNKSSLNNMRRALPHIRKSYNKINNQESYDEQISALMAYADDNPYKYKLMRLSVANNQFNYYSSGNQDTWGFMVYPPDAGLLRTGDLAKIGNEGKYAYKGAINSTEKQGDFIQLPCTLQEWERRLKVQNHKLKVALKSFHIHTKSHQDNLNSLGRMEGLLNIYSRYPYEYQESETATQEEFNKLTGEVKTLTQEIQDIMENPNPEKDRDIKTALDNINASTAAIVELFKADGFREQLAIYQKAMIENEQNVSPYMALDETWHSVYGTIADALLYLSSSPSADEVFKTLIGKDLESLLSSNMVTELIKNGQAEMVGDMEDSGGDQIPVNQQGEIITETHDELNRVISNIYLEVAEDDPEPSLLGQIFNSDLYNVKDELNQWVNKTPGAPSVLMVILENYSSFILSEAMRKGSTKGYHIRLLMLVGQVFSLLGDGQVKESSILSILRSNQQVRNAAKISILTGSRHKALAEVSVRKDTIKNIEKRKETAKKSEKLSLNNRLNRLEKKLAEEEAVVQGLSDSIDYKVKKQIAIEQGKTEKFVNNRASEKIGNADEYYERADGRNARVYKSVLTVIHLASLVEDFSRVARLNQDQSKPKVDADIVLAHYAKTVTDSTVALSSTLVLINRWIGSDSAIFSSGQFLKDGGYFISKMADRIAVGGGILNMYISSRELYEDYNNKSSLEKTDLILGLTADSLTTIGYILAKSGSQIAAPRLLGYFSSFLIPGLGQVLMIIGAMVMIVQLGIALYNSWQGRQFRKNGPVGYYFWQEFENIKNNSQRYYHEDYYVSARAAETDSYKKLFDTYDGDGLLANSTDAIGWGHLSWRGAVPLYVTWRRMGMTESQLINMIEHLSRVPNIEKEKEVIKSPLSTEVIIEKLLSPEAIVKFYLHLEETQALNPNKNILFKAGDNTLSYQAVMSQLEKGIYMPKGETEDVLQHLKGIDDIKSLSHSQFTSFQVRTKHVVWDHEHFKRPIP